MVLSAIINFLSFTSLRNLRRLTIYTSFDASISIDALSVRAPLPRPVPSFSRPDMDFGLKNLKSMKEGAGLEKLNLSVRVWEPVNPSNDGSTGFESLNFTHKLESDDAETSVSVCVKYV